MIATRTEAAWVTGRARRLFTREDYHAMGRMGVLRPDERVELIEGEIIVISPAGILQHDEIESHSEPGPNGYRIMHRFLPGDSLAPNALPDLQLQANRIVPPRNSTNR